MTKKHFIELARYIRTNRKAFSMAAIDTLADFCQSQNAQFNRSRWLAFIAGTCGPNGGEIKVERTPYRPETGQRCSCRPGIERDNCPACEGTGMRIDFAAIRARNS